MQVGLPKKVKRNKFCGRGERLAHEFKYQGTSITMIRWFPFSKSKAFSHAAR
jgi:hypothetical protein